MSLGTAIHQIRDYTISTPVYQGPLDLLLQLIEKAELDITKLALAQVTDQYLLHLKEIQEYAADEVSAFIVIAARLIQIKSEALLPRPPVRQSGEEDPGDALARQLIAYKRYRQISDLLAEREIARLHTHLRIAPPLKLEATVDLSGITLEDLYIAANLVFGQTLTNNQFQNIVPIPRVSIREKIASVANALRLHRQITFQTLLITQHSPLEIVVTFLALLELVKRHLVQASQEQIFGDIQIIASETWNENEDFELEFGE